MSIDQQTLDVLTMLGPWAIFGLLVFYGAVKVICKIVKRLAA